MIIADVDGTLVDYSGTSYPGIEGLVDLASRPGYEMALASARPPWSLQGIARTLGRAVTALSAFQGAMVQTRSDGPDSWREVQAVPIDAAVVRDLEAVLDPSLARWWYTAHSWTVSRDDAAALTEARITGRRWSAVDQQPPAEPVFKLLAVGEPERVARAAPSVNGASCVVSKPQYLEVVSSNVGPDKGIEAMRMLHPPVVRLVALGDGLNDIGMLAAADLAFTFADAPPEVIAAATEVLPADRTRAYERLVCFLQAGH